MERVEWNKFIKIYPNQKARIAADMAVDEADKNNPHLTLDMACGIWSDAYTAIAGMPNFKQRGSSRL